MNEPLAFSWQDGTVKLGCGCGWETPRHATWEAAGRDLDEHLAKVFPCGTERKAHNCTGVSA